jgi:hypothetical protein
LTAVGVEIKPEYIVKLTSQCGLISHSLGGLLTILSTTRLGDCVIALASMVEWVCTRFGVRSPSYIHNLLALQQLAPFMGEPWRFATSIPDEDMDLDLDLINRNRQDSLPQVMAGEMAPWAKEIRSKYADPVKTISGGLLDFIERPPCVQSIASLLVRVYMHATGRRIVCEPGPLIRSMTQPALCPIVLCPTHRSVMDFVSVHLMMDSMAMMGSGLRSPQTAAALGFYRVPLLGKVLQALGAVWIQRRGEPRDNVSDEGRCPLTSAKRLISAPLSQVFIEGGRRRDGRPRKVHSGLLRRMIDTRAGNLKADGTVCATIVPCAIAYEDAPPDQPGMDRELSGLGLAPMGAPSAMAMLWATVRYMLQGNPRTRIWIDVGAPISVLPGSDMQQVVERVRVKQLELERVCSAHVAACSLHTGIPIDLLTAGLVGVGCRVEPGALPADLHWTLGMPVMVRVASLLPERWRTWVLGCSNEGRPGIKSERSTSTNPQECASDTDEVGRLRRELGASLENAESTGRKEMISGRPITFSALLQRLDAVWAAGAASILAMDVDLAGTGTSVMEETDNHASDQDSDPADTVSDAVESVGRWGYTDSRLQASRDHTTGRVVCAMTSDRYAPALGKTPIPELWALVETELGVTLPIHPEDDELQLEAPPSGTVRALCELGLQASDSASDRWRASCGHGMADLIMMRCPELRLSGG